MSSLGNPPPKKVARKRRFHYGRMLYSNYFVGCTADVTGLYSVSVDLLCDKHIRHFVVSRGLAC
jgi:hypothetical protein